VAPAIDAAIDMRLDLRDLDRDELAADIRSDHRFIEAIVRHDTG
jgi:hypothetical protein